MARKARAKPLPHTVVRTEVVVREILVEDARVLMTVQPAAPIWKVSEKEVEIPVEVKGAIVRVKPPAGILAERIDWFVGELKLAGAVAVKVLPPEKADRPVAQVKAKGQTAAKTVREVVAELAKNAGQQELLALCEEIMDVEGV